MGGGDHDTGVGPIVSGGKAQSRHRHESVIDADLYAIGGQNFGGLLGKYVRIDPAVVGDGYQLVAALGLYPVGETLGGLPDYVDVHPIGAGTQNAPQTGGAELQCYGESLLDLVIVSGNLGQLLGQCRVLQLGLRPAFVFIQIHVIHLSSHMVIL